MDIRIRTTSKTETTDITDDVAKQISIDNGVCHAITKHTTCGIAVNEANDPNLADDIHESLNDILPADKEYKHDRVDNNAEAHIKATLMGNAATIPVVNGDLDLGTWQRLLLFEFDGGQTRTITIICTETI